MQILRTSRLTLRTLAEDDAAFILELLNDLGWLRYIGDRGVRTLDDARRYIVDGPAAMQLRHGFSLYLVERAKDGAALGLCGLIRRAGLADVDIGFAFLARHRGQGYASEAAEAVMAHATGPLGLTRIVGITLPENAASIRLLGQLGLAFERTVTLPGSDEVLMLFGYGPDPAAADAGS
ncbi:GNAT family N-acetyltransferase [Chitinimonas koreensis]|uniref:GNAT family N-acetyltransferase n=1 Tax=Chitinimonas koreensis TaxID=356302 RepID=UPI0004067FD9|nr:GNAT family N-acetyltransferase [Chitinimonas koreensis]QNM95403.1 GNAT family N-acetyltransferase [Chitinimonas koreensis]